MELEVFDVEEMKAKGDVEGLTQALHLADSSNARAAAAEALGEIGHVSAIGALVAALKGKRWDMRIFAAEVLSKLGWQPDTDEARIAYWIAREQWDRCVEIGVPAVEPLIAALKYEDWPARSAAAQALGEIGDARAVESLIASLEDQNDRVRRAVAEALGKLGWQPDTSETEVAYWVALHEWEKCVKIGTPAVKPLIAAFKVIDSAEWGNVVAALQKIGGAYVVEALIAALQDETDDRREAAAGALGEIGDTRAVEPLITALRDKSRWVRMKVIWSLRKIGAPAVPSLIAALRNSETNREAVVEALGEMRDVRAVEVLVAALKNEAAPMREAAAEALGKIGDVRAVKPLIAALGDEDRCVRKAAAMALGMIGDARAVTPLISALSDEDHSIRGAAAIALGQIGDARAVVPLLETLKDKEAWVRQATIWGLAKIGDARCVAPLIAALKDKRGDVRETAAEALGWIGDVRAVEPLIAALADRRVRRAVVQALGEIGDTRAVSSLLVALEDQDSLVREAAVKALAKLGDAQAVKPLVAALADKSSMVREAVARALDDLGWQPDTSEAGAAYWVAKQQWNRCVEIGATAVKPLIAVLEDDHWETRMAAARALDELAWQPDTSEIAVAYWIAKQEWDKCVEIGAPAVERLLVMLLDDNVNVRCAALESLERMYQSGQLDEVHKKMLTQVATKGKLRIQASIR
jgi:HEAT repeat protein